MHNLRDPTSYPSLETLSDRDLVLLDYSVNDGIVFKSSADSLESLANSLEAIVRNLMKRGNGSYPAIVMVEHWPYGHEAYYSPKPPPPDGTVPDYAVAYRRVARHYKLPIWSYREAVSRNRIYTHRYPALVQWVACGAIAAAIAVARLNA